MSHETADPEPALLRDAQQGNKVAFASLYRRHVEDVTRYVQVRIGARDPDAVEDVVQDTFCTALAELGSAHTNVRTWLIRLAARACTRHEWNRRRYLRVAITVAEHLTRARGEVAHSAAGDPTGPRLTHALAMLPPRLRRIAQLRWLEGYPRELVARLLHRSPGTVRATERQALRRMHASLTTPDASGPRITHETAREER
jgi:RNA polymerase sigma factor (sigma-70 family)